MLKTQIFRAVVLMIALTLASFGQIPNIPTYDCIEEHPDEGRAIYALQEMGCVLDYTEYTARGDYWTAYGHFDLVSEFLR